MISLLVMLLIIPFNTTVPYDQLPDTINVVVVDLNGTIHDRMNYTTNQFDNIGNYSMIYQLPIDKEIPDAFHVSHDEENYPLVYTLIEDSKEPFTVITIDDQPDYSDIISSKISLLIILIAVMIATIGLVIRRRDKHQKEDVD